MALVTLAEPPAQDFIILGGLKSPGIATIRAAGSPRKFDIREGYGVSGGQVNFTGNGIPQFEVDIYIWTAAHWLDWRAFALILAKPGPGFQPRFGVGISHPQLSVPPLDIHQVHILDVSQFVQDDEGGWECTIKFVEWRKPMEALGTTVAAIPAIAKPPPTAQDAADRAIASKLATLNALAAGGK